MTTPYVTFHKDIQQPCSCMEGPRIKMIYLIPVEAKQPNHNLAPSINPTIYDTFNCTVYYKHILSSSNYGRDVKVRENGK